MNLDKISKWAEIIGVVAGLIFGVPAILAITWDLESASQQIEQTNATITALNKLVEQNNDQIEVLNDAIAEIHHQTLVQAYANGGKFQLELGCAPENFFQTTFAATILDENGNPASIPFRTKMTFYLIETPAQNFNDVSETGSWNYSSLNSSTLTILDEFEKTLVRKNLIFVELGGVPLGEINVITIYEDVLNVAAYFKNVEFIDIDVSTDLENSLSDGVRHAELYLTEYSYAPYSPVKKSPIANYVTVSEEIKIAEYDYYEDEGIWQGNWSENSPCYVVPTLLL